MTQKHSEIAKNETLDYSEAASVSADLNTIEYQGKELKHVPFKPETAGAVSSRGIG